MTWPMYSLHEKECIRLSFIFYILNELYDCHVAYIQDKLKRQQIAFSYSIQGAKIYL